MAVSEERLTDRASRNWSPTPADAPHLAQLTGSDSAPSNIIVFPGGGTSPVPTTKDNETEQRFRRLADEWIQETSHFSDPVRKFMHRAHFKIIGMGERALPFILKEVERMSGHWFVALDAISPVNPVRPEDETSFDRTAKAWIEWGKSEGLI